MTANRSKIPYLPDALEGLADVALNFSWRWNRHARALFWDLDPTLWGLQGRNPIALLRRIEPARLQARARDPEFMALYEKVMEAATAEQSNSNTWFTQSFPEFGQHKVAYFCAEFGIHKSVPIYSGGLGVLAGDHCKASSDLGVPLLGVGLLYLKGYFDQQLTLDGWQVDNEEQFDLRNTPL
ncbi:MAG: DUF3417 domain-containing protein, partial [Gemmatimonadota bacterium]